MNTDTTQEAAQAIDQGAATGKLLVAILLYYVPVTILSLAQVDFPRIAMMAAYLLPFVAVPLLGLMRLAARHRPAPALAHAR